MDVAAAAGAEAKVGPLHDGPGAEPAPEDVGVKVSRGQHHQCPISRLHDHGIDAERSQQRCTAGRGCERCGGRIWPHQSRRMRVEGERDGRHVEPSRGGADLADDRRMAQMHAVEVSHGDGAGR